MFIDGGVGERICFSIISGNANGFRGGCETSI